MIAAEPATHIKLDRSGVAWIDHTNVKVVEVILDHLAYGHSPEEIHLHHPHLSLAQVHAAFAYYFDHQGQLDGDLDRRYRRVQALKEKIGPFLSRRKLQARLRRR